MVLKIFKIILVVIEGQKIMINRGGTSGFSMLMLGLRREVVIC